MTLRFAGAAMSLAGILFIGRIAPVVAKKPEDIAFPPANSEELIKLAASAGAAWPIAHVLGLVAVVLVVFAYWRHGEALAKAGHERVGRIAAFIAATGFGLFAIALVIDGFVVYEAALRSMNNPADAALLKKAGDAHQLAILFFTPAMFGMFLAMGVLSSRMLHGYVHSRWLGVIGQIIAIAAITLYLTGLAGPHWDNMQTGGLAMMLGYLWHIIIGLAALFGRGVRVSA
ncbi:MAG: hypothetical protein DHS20C05_17130 [Hyphococcus sp.]|nr:MAG: hypothetical protein DHS20C05_17130 [Marinicaulis sp.]